MKYRGLLLVVAALTVTSIFVTSTSAQSRVHSRTTVAPRWLTAKYSRAYWGVTRKFDRAKAGRNIVTRGVMAHGSPRAATYREVKASYFRLKAWLHPAILSRMVMRSGSPYPPPGYVGKPVIISAGMPACTWVPESHGDYTAHNPSGAGGKYQMMPGLWHAYGGTGNAWQAPPAEQELVARRVYEAEGTQPWSQAAGGNC